MHKNIKHAIIIRMHYPKNDARFKWRFGYFKKMVLPRILAQTDQNFDIAIRCNPIHAKMFKKLSPKIKTFSVRFEIENYKTIKDKKYFVDFVPWRDVVGLEQYDIQSGLDSDDLIEPDYIKTIHKTIKENGLENNIHLSFQPELYNADTKRKYPMRHKYGPRHGSAFFSIYQPDKTRYIFAYENSHLKLWKYFKKSITLPVGFCAASVHGHNISTKMYG